MRYSIEVEIPDQDAEVFDREIEAAKQIEADVVTLVVGHHNFRGKLLAHAKGAEIDEAIPGDLRLSFTPNAIREHFEGADDEDNLTLGMSDEQLAEVGRAALTDDGLYRAFHEALTWALGEAAGACEACGFSTLDQRFTACPATKSGVHVLNDVTAR